MESKSQTVSWGHCTYPQMKPTCSSASKSALYWAMSSGSLFWTRLRHSSQMAKPATNMPMSGMNTRMPFPASASITLGTNRKNTGDKHWLKADARFLNVMTNPNIFRELWFGAIVQARITTKSWKMGQSTTNLTVRGRSLLIWNSSSKKFKDLLF